MLGKTKLKKICIYGVGGVGGYFGGLLSHALSPQHKQGYEIYFVARGAHLQEIRKNGLILNTSKKTGLLCKPTLAVERFEELPAVDLILLTVKGYDLDQTMKEIARHIQNDTMIIPLLNGVDIYQRIRKVLTTGIVFPACVYVVSNIEKPGIVTQKGADGKIIFGKDLKRPEVVPQEVLDLFKHAGISFTWTENAFPAIWEKYLFIAPFALVTGRYGATFGSLMASPELKEKTRQLMDEVIAIAKFESIEFRDTVITETLDKANKFPYDSKTSFQRDLEQKGKKNEGDLFGGTIIRLGKKYGVKTPVAEELYTFIQKNLQ